MKFFLYSSLLFLTACASTAKIGDPFVEANYYVTHARLGEVRTNHPQYNRDHKECEQQAYGDGVEVNGKLIKGRFELSKIELKYSQPIKIQLKRKHQTRENHTLYNAVQAGISAATGAPAKQKKPTITIHTDAVERDYARVKHPSHILKIMEKNKVYDQCFYQEKQWGRQNRVEWIDTRNGNLVSEYKI